MLAPARPAAVSQDAAPVWRDAWHASLALGFARHGDRTVLARRRHTGPLVVQKTLYPEGPGVCHAIVLHPPAGLAAGDELSLDVALDAGAHAVLTTPGATKWYKATPERPARQRIALAVGEGARLDWLPQDNIYFDHSHAEQEIEVRLAAGATAIGWDAALLGRRAGGETWTNAALRVHTRLLGPDGAPLWEERQCMRSGDAILAAGQGLAGQPAYGTLWAVAPACTPDLAQSLAAELPFADPVRAGATALPGGVLLVRAVAADPEPLRELFVRLWLRLRPLVHGVAARPLRIWST